MRWIRRTSALWILLLTVITVQARMNTETLYEQAMEAFKTGNYGNSELIFRKIVDADDDFRDRSWFHLALSIFHQKKYEASIFEFNRFLLSCSTANLCSESRYWIAESYYHLKSYIKAIEEYKKFISQKGNERMTIASIDRIGDIYFIQGRYDEAVIEWKSILSKSIPVDQKYRITIKIGESLYFNESYDEAQDLLEPIITAKIDKKTTSHARLILGRILQIKEKPREALKMLTGIPESLLGEYPFYDARYYKALSYLALKDVNAAKSNLELFLVIGKESDYLHDAKYELGRLMIKEKHEKQGIELLEEVRESTVKMELRSKAATVLAKIYLKTDPKKALPYLEDSVSLSDPDEQKVALLLLSRVYIEVKRYDDAERILELLMNKYPYDKNLEHVQFLLSRVYLEKGDTKRAVAGFNNIKNINPFSKYIDESGYFLALASHRNEKTQTAIDHLVKYLKLRKVGYRFEANVLLNKLYIEKEEYKKASRVMDVLLRKYSSHDGMDEILYNFAQQLEGANGLSRKYFQFLLKKYNHSEYAGMILLKWGDEKFKEGEYRAAEGYYRQYLSVVGRSSASSVFLYRMISLYKMRRYRDVITLSLENRIPGMDSLTRKMVDIWMARSYFSLNAYDKALEVYGRCPLIDYRDRELLTMLKCALEIDQMSRAEQILRYMKSDPASYAEALYFTGNHYLKKERYDAAIEVYRSALSLGEKGNLRNHIRLKLAESLIAKNDAEDALAVLNEVVSRKYEDQKYALLILGSYKTGDGAKALELTRKHLETLKETVFGETILRESLRYACMNKDMETFAFFARILRKIRGNERFVNYYSGKINFETENFNSAYYYFYRLAHNESDYHYEALYHLGLISYYSQKNTKLAMKYFNKILKDKKGTGEYRQKVKLFMSIYLNETGKAVQSKEYLKEIMKDAPDSETAIQAKNLFEHFGYSH